MKVKATVTVELKSTETTDIAWHAMGQHGTVRRSGKRVTLERKIATSHLPNAVEMMLHSARVIMDTEADIVTYTIVAVSVEVL